MDDLISITEAAELAGVDRTNIWQLYKKGRFPSARVIGNQIVLVKAEVEAYYAKKASNGNCMDHIACVLSALILPGAIVLAELLRGIF